MKLNFKRLIQIVLIVYFIGINSFAQASIKYDIKHLENNNNLNKIFKPLKNEYNLDVDTMYNIAIDTYVFKKNIDIMKEAIKDKLYNKYIELAGDRNINEAYKYFPSRYKLLKKMIYANRFTDCEIKEHVFENYNSYFVSADEKLYKNLSDVDTQILISANKITFYSKKSYKNLKVLSKAINLKNKYCLSEKDFDLISRDTYNFTENIKIIEEALDNNNFDDFNKIRNYSAQPQHFKENYKTYIIMKENNYDDQQISNIVNTYGIKIVSPLPKYWGTKDKKIKKIINNSKLNKEEKYLKMCEKVQFSKPPKGEVAAHITAKTIAYITLPTILFSWVGMIILCAEDSNPVHWIVP